MNNISENAFKLEDVSDASYGERLQHYLNQYGGKDFDKRIKVLNLAEKSAMEEMLNEIHCMLRYLIEKKDKNE